MEGRNTVLLLCLVIAESWAFDERFAIVPTELSESLCPTQYLNTIEGKQITDLQQCLRLCIRMRQCNILGVAGSNTRRSARTGEVESVCVLFQECNMGIGDKLLGIRHNPPYYKKLTPSGAFCQLIWLDTWGNFQYQVCAGVTDPNMNNCDTIKPNQEILFSQNIKYNLVSEIAIWGKNLKTAIVKLYRLDLKKQLFGYPDSIAKCEEARFSPLKSRTDKTVKGTARCKPRRSNVISVSGISKQDEKKDAEICTTAQVTVQGFLPHKTHSREEL